MNSGWTLAVLWIVSIIDMIRIRLLLLLRPSTFISIVCWEQKFGFKLQHRCFQNVRADVMQIMIIALEKIITSPFFLR